MCVFRKNEAATASNLTSLEKEVTFSRSAVDHFDHISFDQLSILHLHFSSSWGSLHWKSSYARTNWPRNCHRNWPVFLFLFHLKIEWINKKFKWFGDLKVCLSFWFFIYSWWTLFSSVSTIILWFWNLLQTVRVLIVSCVCVKIILLLSSLEKSYWKWQWWWSPQVSHFWWSFFIWNFDFYRWVVPHDVSFIEKSWEKR